MAASDERVIEFAYELNVSLAVIAGHAAALRSQLDRLVVDPEAMRRAVDGIARASGSAAELTRELLAEVRNLSAN